MTIGGRMGRLACMGLVLAGTAFGQLGQLGTTVDDARKTDLFTFFHLKETERDAAVVHFRSSGDFHDQAEVNLVLTGERLTGARLTLARSFLKGTNGIFAKDLMLSFLHAVMTQRDFATLGPLIRQASIPQLGGEESSFACSTPAAFDALRDAKLTIRCDEATSLLTFEVVRVGSGSQMPK